ncbi:MAG: hypothetical protein KTR35_01075 [Gammaproteobacteria bacterium]|nr:hypothetical protein [Gammaproteobacteria bacterium]
MANLGLELEQNNFPIFCENTFIQWELTKVGACIGVIMEEIGDNEDSVERVLPDSEAITFPVWLVAHKQLNDSKRIRTVFDHLSESFAEC